MSSCKSFRFIQGDQKSHDITSSQRWYHFVQHGKISIESAYSGVMMSLIERLVKSKRFESKDITITTPYTAQLKNYRQAFEAASKTDFWKSRVR